MDDRTRSQIAEYVTHEGAGVMAYMHSPLRWEYLRVLSQYMTTLRKDRGNW